MDALTQALLTSIAAGLIVGIIGFIFLQRSDAPPREKMIKVLGVGGIAIIIIIFLFVLQSGNLVQTPDLIGMSEAQAHDILLTVGLDPNGLYQTSDTTPKNYVIPYSQDPSAGTYVRKGTEITFSISKGSQTPDSITPPPTTPPQNSPILILSPQNGQNVNLVGDSSGVYHFDVSGSSTGIPSTSMVLLWVDPVNPPGDKVGYYLQRHPNGIEPINQGGSWAGKGQLGNAEYPPQNGQTFKIIVTVLDGSTAQQLMDTQGDVVRTNPPGSASAQVQGLVVKI